MQRQNEPAPTGGGWLSSAYQNLGYGASSTNNRTEALPERKEGGGRRERLAGYIRAANEIRQNYYSSRGAGTPARGSRWNVAYEESAFEPTSNQELMEYISNGNEAIVLFPTYGRSGLKEFRKDSGECEPASQADGDPMVEVNVRGWIYTPHTALPPSRKNRFAMAMVAKLCGVPNVDSSQDISSTAQEESQADRFVENNDITNSSANNASGVANNASGAGGKISWIASKYGQSYAQQSPSISTGAEVRESSNALRARLSPFLTTPSVNMPLTVFFYNSKNAQSVTTRTDTLGHFAIRKSLPFSPTHIRALAGETLCAEDRISYIDAESGISLISDIDDTIKISGIGSGLREMFRNVFTRDIATMPVPGVADWFNDLAREPCKVQIHYLSNSPWQLFPFLKELLVGHMGLPLGTWHLKKYSGFVQGIFEPVIERKKESLEGLLTSFPGRKWILVGDGGEGDLEAYTDVVKRWPGHVIAVYIRDVSGIGEEVVGPGTGAQDFFDGNTTGDGMYSLNFGKWPPDPLQKDTEDLIDLELHSLNRSGSDLSDHFRKLETRPETQYPIKTPTWGGTSSITNSGTPANSNKSPPPPIPSKPKELRGSPIPAQTTDVNSITKPKIVSQKTGSYEYFPKPSESIAALYDGRDYGPPSPSPPRLPIRRGTGASSITSSLKSGSSIYNLSKPGSTASLVPTQSNASQQVSTNPSQKPLDKKAELWKKRWEYARGLLAEQGVVLRSWKVGQDVHAECVELVQSLLNEQTKGRNNPEKLMD